MLRFDNKKTKSPEANNKYSHWYMVLYEQCFPPSLTETAPKVVRMKTEESHEDQRPIRRVLEHRQTVKQRLHKGLPTTISNDMLSKGRTKEGPSVRRVHSLAHRV